MKRRTFTALLAACWLSPALAEPASRAAAVAFVKKAVAYLGQNGKSKALAEFNDPKGRFVDGELYIVALDLDGVVLADANQPKMVGKSLYDIRDMNGKYFVREELEQARAQGQGWVEFVWPHPVSKQLAQRASYFERAGDVIVLTGIYNAK
ncbi:cache domain-containing protein [Duganella radicis]|uniref:Histidine kinase n=1 Tax=Duganella radicis TaxID=551988 RepID=A0A6L6PD81_9BURK|nr:cache domain-containing protein [Duganella radicis]MTV37008.1 histidine kinase [Duganella radicis]